MTEPRHRAVTGASGELEPRVVPPAGPIALRPEPDAFFVEAITRAGGTVAELDGDTRGLVWLASRGGEELSALLREHPGIGWVQLPWAGVDAFSAAIAEHGERVLFTSAKGAYAQPVAEHVLALTLALLRELPTRVTAGTWGPKLGRTLYGANVVIVGAGGTALELVRLLEPFGARVTIVRRERAPVAGVERTVTTDTFAEVLGDADVVVLAAALGDDTVGLVGDAELWSMKSDAVLVNVGRGRLVDTDALVAALATNRIAGAALDVTDPEPLPDGHPLWEEPRAIITPHSADTPEMTTPLLAERVELNVRAFLSGTGFVGVVDPIAGY